MENTIKKCCFLCSTTNLIDSIDIFGDTGKQLNIEQIINRHFGITLMSHSNDDEKYLKKIIICNYCWTVTHSFHQLYKKVQKNNTELFSKTLNIIKDVPKKNNFIENVKIEEHVNNFNEPATEEYENNYAIKAEPLLIVSNLDDYCHTIDLNADKVDSDNDYDPIAGISGDSETNKLQTKKKLQKKNNSDEKIKKKSKKGKKLVNQQKQISTKNKIKTKEEIDLENQQISNYFKMTCDICNENLVNFVDARSHYNRVHQQLGYLICCNKKFHRRSRILDHINRHLNPDAYKCPECNKMYVDKQALKKHMEHHAPIDQRQFKCDICTSSFTKLFKLSQHLRLTHCSPTDKIFQCAECDKSFITKSILTTHIRGVHEFAYAHVCHICAKTFKSKQVYELHQREHMDIEVPKVQCKICGAWLKHEHSLRKHMYRHSDGEAICTVCNKVTSNKEALRSHMRNVHRERTHLCTLCDKAFIKARSLKEHMATHTGEDIYTCTYCPITFKSSANMHSHQKKIHTDEWLLAKAKRQKP